MSLLLQGAIGALVFLPLGVYSLSVLEPEVLKRIIAVAVAVSTLILLTGWRMQRKPSVVHLAALGALTGVVGGSTYILILTVAVLLAMPFNVAQVRASFIVISFCIAVPLIVMHLALQNLTLPNVAIALALGALYTAGAWWGDRVFRRTGEERYRRLVLWLLIVIAVIVAVR